MSESASSLVGAVHGKLVHGRRTKVLRRHLSALIPPGSSILDVGCGDGLLAKLIADAVPDSTIEGMDVLVRPETHIPVEEFDGTAIPLADNSQDVVLLVDVLHHTENPEILFGEATRVSRRAVIIKDHLRKGFLARATLRFMDWVGNAHHHVALPYNYLSKPEWDALFDRSDVRVDSWNPRLGLYPFPANLIFDRSLHFIASLRVGDDETMTE